MVSASPDYFLEHVIGFSDYLVLAGAWIFYCSQAEWIPDLTWHGKAGLWPPFAYGSKQACGLSLALLLSSEFMQEQHLQEPWATVKVSRSKEEGGVEGFGSDLVVKNKEGELWS